MNSPDPVSNVTSVAVAAAMPWYQSPVQRAQITSAVSALVALSPKLGKLIGISTPADVEGWVEAVFGVITLVAPIVGSILRARSTIQPLTLTKAAAEAHPQTVAVKAATNGVSDAPATAAADPAVLKPPV